MASKFEGDYTVFKGGKAWGVKQGGVVLYDAMFLKSIAVRVSQLNGKTPRPRDWEHTKEILLKAGFKKRHIEHDPNNPKPKDKQDAN